MSRGQFLTYPIEFLVVIVLDHTVACAVLFARSEHQMETNQVG